MRYVKAIEAYPEGRVKQIYYNVRNASGPVHVIVHDTVTDSDKDVRASKVSELSGVEGFHWSRESVETAIVCHTLKSLQLHQFIQSSVTFSGLRGLDLDASDICVWQAGARPDNSGVVGYRRLAVNTGRDVISVLGTKGTVAVWKYGFVIGVEVFNIYDLLCKLCRACDLNVMRYSRIQLYSRHASVTTTIWLRHDDKSELFFTKMSLDVARS